MRRSFHSLTRQYRLLSRKNCNTPRAAVMLMGHELKKHSDSERLATRPAGEGKLSDVGSKIGINIVECRTCGSGMCLRK